MIQAHPKDMHGRVAPAIALGIRVVIADENLPEYHSFCERMLGHTPSLSNYTQPILPLGSGTWQYGLSSNYGAGGRISMSLNQRTSVRYIRRTLLLLSASSVFVSLAAAQVCPPVPTIDPARSLVVTDAALDKAKFSFVNTIDAILGSLNVAATSGNRENFVRSLLTSMNDDDMVNPASGLRMKVDIRPLEAGLDPKKLFDPNDPTGLVPVGLFNRLDLAPQDGPIAASTGSFIASRHQSQTPALPTADFF
jgi:hypothetical protein